MSTFVLIEKYTVGAGGVSSVTLGSGGTIPQTYTDLKVLISARNSYASAGDDWLNIKFNSSTTSYSYRLLQGTGSGAYSYNNTVQYVGDIVANGATSNTFGNMEIYLPNYAGSNYKSYSVDAVTEWNNTFALTDLLAGLWSSTAAITSLTFTPRNNSFVQYSTFYLYGILKA